MNKCRYRDDRGKVCTKCDKYKLFSEYYKLHIVKDGLQSQCKSCMSKSNTVRSKKTGAVAKSRDTKKRTYGDRIFYTYRVSKDEAARLAQVPACECCGAPLGEGGRMRHVDHSYATGQVRGVLCAQCNTGLGKLGDSVAGVERAAMYLVSGVDVLDLAASGQTYLPECA